MTRKAPRFNPEALLSAPRRSSAIASPDGKFALYTLSKYSFETHTKATEIRILDLDAKESRLFSASADVIDIQWLPGSDCHLVWLERAAKGRTLMKIGEGTNSKETPSEVAEFDGPVANLKLAPPRDSGVLKENVLFAVSGQRDGPRLYNPETATSPHSSARVYSRNYVRHWDHYVTEQPNAVFIGRLRKERESWTTTSSQGRWVCTSGLDPISANDGYECPIPPFGGSGDFDVNPAGFAFVAKDPNNDPSAHTSTHVLALSIPNDEAGPRRVDSWLEKRHGLEGAASSPRISPDGRHIAFLKMRLDGYESDKNVPCVTHFSGLKEEVGRVCDELDLSPHNITWSPNSRHIILEAESNGQNELFLWDTAREHPVSGSAIQPISRPSGFDSLGSFAAISILPSNSDDLEFISSSNSLTESSAYHHLTISHGKIADTVRLLSSASHQGAAFGLSPSQCSQIKMPSPSNAIGYVPAWLIYPSDYDKKKSYPFAMLIHGGPQGAWTNSWSTRWNPVVFAEAGYVVMCPNPTGSTSYGQVYVDAIANHWGGQPYEDLVTAFEYAQDHLPAADTKRAVALGASYGGYMVNYIQGMPLGREFKALVTHDGVFSTRDQYTSEELYFPEHDFGGKPWENREGYAKWDPAAPEKLQDPGWTTPHLIVHSDLDYRLPIGQGIAAFNVLQRKGTASRFLNFPDENHWVLKAENSLVWHKEVLGWIHKYSAVK